MQEQLNLLIEKHCKTIKEQVGSLGAMLSRVEAGDAGGPQSLLAEAEALAHQLKGSTGTAGFLELSKAATALDDHLKSLCAGGRDFQTAHQRFAELAQITTAIRPENSVLYRATA